jgi:MoxR-like ATPase
MIFVVDCLQVLLNQLRVDLRGGNVAVAEHLLDGAQISAVFKQMGRKAVAERVLYLQYIHKGGGSLNQTGRILEEVKKAVCGKDRVLVWVLTVLLARGHVLLEDIPGVGKTTMALAFSRALGLEYGRVQFTPDVLPSDITGYSVYQKETGKLVYQPGAVLCNLFLADELNRATSRTQSALLEAMEEGQVTVDGVSHPIPQPFIVFATQNPTGAAGTQLLPDSQMDRFTVRLSIGYPAPEDERNMVLARQGVNPLQTVCQVLSRDELIAMQDEAAAVYIKTELIDYIVALIDATRKHPMILRGASPRATLSLTAMAKAVAYVQRRDYVVPKDIQVTFPQVIAHRLLLAPEAGARQITPEQLLDEILHQVPSPRL